MSEVSSSTDMIRLLEETIKYTGKETFVIYLKGYAVKNFNGTSTIRFINRVECC